MRFDFLRSTAVHAALLVGALTACAAPRTSPVPVAAPAARAALTVVAHRGASGYAPEHTLAAYDLALTMGADYLEQDLQRTRDGVLVVLHDATLDRTARGPAADCTGAVNTKTLAQLQRCEVGSWFNAAYPARARAEFATLRIPTLDDVLARYRGRTRFYIETKTPEDAPGMEEQLVAALARFGVRGAGDSVLVQSFSAASLRRMHEIAPSLPLVQLTDSAAAADLADIATYAVGVGPNGRGVDRAFVERAHARCLVVHPYTINDSSAMTTMRDAGVDGMFTNFPDRLAALRGRSDTARRAISRAASCARGAPAARERPAPVPRAPVR